MSSGKNHMFINFFRNSFCHNPLSRYDRYIQFVHLLSKVGKSDISSTAFFVFPGFYKLSACDLHCCQLEIPPWFVYICSSSFPPHGTSLNLPPSALDELCTFFVILCAINASKLCTQKTVILLLLEAQRARQDTEDVLGHPWQPNCCFIHLDKYQILNWHLSFVLISISFLTGICSGIERCQHIN